MSRHRLSGMGSGHFDEILHALLIPRHRANVCPLFRLNIAAGPYLLCKISKYICAYVLLWIVGMLCRFTHFGKCRFAMILRLIFIKKALEPSRRLDVDIFFGLSHLKLLCLCRMLTA